VVTVSSVVFDFNAAAIRCVAGLAAGLLGSERRVVTVSSVVFDFNAAAIRCVAGLAAGL
jgi:hypothetical protein